MLRLSLLLFTVIGATMAGIGVVVALSLGWYEVMPIVLTAAVGAGLAIPFSWYVARQLQTQ